MINNIEPVCLGTDLNTYGVARAFHMKYGIKSHAFGMADLLMTKHSTIIDVTVVDNFTDDQIMVDTLVNYKKKNKDKDLILFAAGEHYVMRILKNYDYLKDHYHIPYCNPALGIKLSDKRNFYNLCQEYDLAYPKTYTISKNDYKNLQFDLEYPLILKASESADYFYLDFEGKEKAYIIKNKQELLQKLDLIYKTSYPHDFLIQELVEGPITNELVMNVYSDKKANVKLMSLGRIAFDDPDPLLRGNYVAITSLDQGQAMKDLCEKTKNFLENIQFTGLSNFDFKLDQKDNKIKCFEINLRQGRSSFFSILSGANFAKPICDDIMNRNDTSIIYGDKPFIWLNCGKNTFFELLSEKSKALYDKTKNIENIGNTLVYDGDRSVLRNINVSNYYKRYDKKIKSFFKE